ncbi:hypothetical protein [Fibrella forsythiae]|uniref:Uncharacterized protein n=1 Tax=Fibrella forsythiae TaxID=2817061 RepID=A0ABS3JL03_9BACT|nr:hypothetical protein [Fibrella forsythiae]MBO0950675.1 hypothetical protein [Fibrella forsythiae]
MRSDRYYYLNIYHDEQLSVDFDTQQLTDFIKSLSQFEQKEKFSFTNSKQFTVFTNITLLFANQIHSWSSLDSGTRTNLVSIVCAKDPTVDFQIVQNVLVQIATYLNWQWVDEQTDDEIENFVLWKPRDRA